MGSVQKERVFLHFEFKVKEIVNQACSLKILCFLQTEGLLAPLQVCWCYFSNRVCSFRVSLSYLGNSYNIANLFIGILSVMVISGQ